MNNTQAVLAAMNRMQSNAQAALPVSPNNGNPGGAYNMPHGGQQAQPAAPPDPWPWLQPSPFMQSLQQDLQIRSERLKQELSSLTPSTAPAVMPAPEAPSQREVPTARPTVGSVLRNMVTNQQPLAPPTTSTAPAQPVGRGGGWGGMVDMPVLPVRTPYRVT